MQESAERRILLVDDEEPLRRMMARWLHLEGYTCTEAASAEAAWAVLQQTPFALVVLDIIMPGMSGMWLLRMLSGTYPDTAVIMVTGVDDRPTGIDALRLGAYGYLIKPFEMNELVINIVNALERRRLTLERQQYEQELEHKILERTAEVRSTQEEVTLTLIAAMRQRDDETGDHIKRMGLYSMAIAQTLGWDEGKAEQIRLASPMHDIGKIGVPDAVLLKPGKLSPEEFAAITRHTLIGAEILADTKSHLLQLARVIALSHHEKWDGSGYPQGLRGPDIPQPAQIVAVADVYDALTHDRVYRPALSEWEALEIMQSGRGRHFAPEVFDAFMDLLPQLRALRHELVPG